MVFFIALILILGYIVTFENKIGEIDNDPGDALFLTKYIESGDIETVILC